MFICFRALQLRLRCYAIRLLKSCLQILSLGKPIKKLPREIPVSPDASTQELHSALAGASGQSVHRLRITKGSDGTVVPNAKGTTISAIGLNEKDVIQVKDLGM